MKGLKINNFNLLSGTVPKGLASRRKTVPYGERRLLGTGLRIATPACARVRNVGAGRCGIAGNVEDSLLSGTVKTVPYGGDAKITDAGFY